MKRADLIMSIVLAIFSIYLMVKSTELPIGWIKDVGPGGGAFTFWLSTIMLGTCIWSIVGWFRGKTPKSWATEPYIDKQSLITLTYVVLSLIFLVGMISFIGIYGSVPLFFIIYLRFIGRYSWWLSTTIAVSMTIFLFMFFEVLLHVTLPKGVTEPLFYPIYDIIYG